MLYPYLPQKYTEFIEKKYQPLIQSVEDRLLYFYTRNTDIRTQFNKPLIVDYTNEKGNYKELVFQHPEWETNLNFYKSPNETIEIPFAKSPRLFGYLPFGIWIDEYVVYIEYEHLEDKKNLEDLIIKSLEAKGTFAVLSIPKNVNLSLTIPIWKTIGKRRIIIETSQGEG